MERRGTRVVTASVLAAFVASSLAWAQDQPAPKKPVRSDRNRGPAPALPFQPDAALPLVDASRPVAPLVLPPGLGPAMEPPRDTGPATSLEWPPLTPLPEPALPLPCLDRPEAALVVPIRAVPPTTPPVVEARPEAALPPASEPPAEPGHPWPYGTPHDFAWL